MAESDKSEHPGSINGRNAPAVRVYPLLGIFVWSVVLLIFFRLFNQLRPVLLGFLAAAAVASVLRPVVGILPTRHSLSGAIVGLSFLLVVAGILALLTWLLVAPVRNQMQQWPALAESLDNLLRNISDRFGLSPPVTIETIGEQIAGIFTSNGLGEIFAQTTDIVTSIGIGLVFVFLGTLYMLVENPGTLVSPVLRLLPSRFTPNAKAALADLGPRLRWWVLGTLVSMTLVGVANYIGYVIIGLQFALPLAIFGGLAEVVPIIGPLLSFLLALMVAATMDLTQIVGVVIVYLIIQILEGYVILPLVMKRAVHIPPVVTLFTIVLWGKVFGFIGVLLALPINLFLWTLLDRFVIRPNDV
ncbi:MAG: AI-2E family transporter [Planctomycetes bacterium]|jgi:predicted PurR-regulated permease PerM|nr:AI-2E family transporter [Planctomycetota bacterium]